MILWQFKDELSDADKNRLGKEIKDSLEALVGTVPGLKEVRVTINPLPSSNADILLDSTVTDEKALQVYADHPDHLKVKDGLIGPNVKTRLCMDFPLGKGSEDVSGLFTL